MKTLYDNLFFLKHRLNIPISSNLPLRLQKKELLQKLGFPMDDNVQVCQVKDKENIFKLIGVYSSSPPFLIIVSQYNPVTITPPLFIVRSADLVEWRDCYGKVREINRREAVHQLDQLSGEDWLEFAYPLWDGRTIAGRLIYTSYESQVLELQRGVVPAQLMQDKSLSLYSGEISSCVIDSWDYLERNKFLKETGHESVLPLTVVRQVCSFFQEKIFSLEELKKISPMPALEFFFGSQGLIIIDVDWPASWITQN